MKRCIWMAWTLFIAPLMVSCGQSVAEKSVKDYRIQILHPDKQVRDSLRLYIEEFNRDAGFQALKLAASADDANSTITLTKGLRTKSEKVGLGQWIAEIHEHRGVTPEGRRQLTRIKYYGMKLEFDLDYFFSHAFLEPESDGRETFKTLFYHEAGHGIGLLHDPNQESVMYEQVGGAKDFPSFFSKVRTHFDR